MLMTLNKIDIFYTKRLEAATDLRFRRQLWQFALNAYDGAVPKLMKDWRGDLFNDGFHLQGASQFVTCGFALMGYGASPHKDKGDPT